MKPYYEHAGITIYHGDCREIIPSLTADVTITDPPYNYGKKYGKHNDDMAQAEYEIWTSLWFNEVRNVTKGQVVFPGVGNLDFWLRLYPTKTIGCWYKPGNPKGGGVFNFCEWEPILFYSTGWVGGSAVFRDTVSQQTDTGDHPCPKPTNLLRQIVKHVRGDVILDPFAGAGSTLLAAKNLGRKAVGIEIEEKYCEIAAKRLAQEVLF